jgi:hypothetical protein
MSDMNERIRRAVRRQEVLAPPSPTTPASTPDGEAQGSGVGGGGDAGSGSDPGRAIGRPRPDMNEWLRDEQKRRRR